MTNQNLIFKRLLSFAVVFALAVIVMGAYTRLSDAGLGCPDWPGCYGHLSVPGHDNHPDYERPLEAGKAWKEMIHRYIAGTLGLLILGIFFLVLKYGKKYKQSIVLPVILLVTVIFQALLGMWTVTLLLSPVIVTAHLLGGLTTLSLLWWLYLNQQRKQRADSLQRIGETSSVLKLFASIGLVLVIVQIFLGGWTSSNYAALACGTDFPTCAGYWWPTMDFSKGFTFLHETGKNYEFGVLDSPARIAIQKIHRIGALIVFVYMLLLAISLLRQHSANLKKLGLLLILLVLSQVTLGILNVMMALPLSIAVLHNLVAALLLISVLTVNHRIRWE